MADTTTPIYSFVLPEIDGSDGTWGTKLNANLTALDGLLSGSANLQNASFTGTASFGGSTGTAGQVLKSQGAGANAIWTDDSNTTYTAGSGLSLTGTEFANTAPDQTVVMNAGSGISVSGTYPTFTVTNSSPDQTVALTGTGGTTISGTYPNFTINSTDTNTTYTAGTGLTLTSTEFSVTDNGIGALQLNVSGNGTSGQFLASDGDGTFSWQTGGAGGNETLAQTLALGAVTGGTDISVSSGDNIVMAANSTVDGRDVSVDGAKLDGIEASADVTDTANVTAAGALMDSELTSIASVKALNQGVATTDSPAFAGLTVDTTTLAVDATNNRVGIGTTSPSKTLVVNENDSECVAIIKSSDTGTAGLFLGGQTDEIKGGIVFNNSDNSLQLRGYNNAERMRIDSSGNVGIGTTAPASKAHILGSSNDTISQANANLNVEGGGGNGMLFGTQATAPYRSYIQAGFVDNLATATYDLLLNPQGGKVGIGTASPASALDVNGTVTCDDLQVDLPNATASCQITTPTNLSGFQSFKISNSHTTGTLTMGTALGAARIQAFGYMGSVMPLKIDLGSVTALDFTTTGITTLGMSGQSQLVLGKRGTLNNFKYVSATAYNSGLQSHHFYGTTMLSSSTSANTIYGVALPSSSTSSRFYPAQSGVNGMFRDNAIDCGHPSARWDDVYATNGTIQTSDEREKQDIEELTDVEQRVAVRAKGLLRKFRWKDSVESKGDDARIHFGIIAQDLEAAFVAEGLDPRDYAMFIKTEWWIGPKTWPSIPEELDEEGNVISEGEDSHVEEEHYYEDEADAPSDATHHYRLGVRYSELLAFIIAAL